MRRCWVILRNFALASSVATSAAYAQVPTGSITGRVTDSASAGIIASVTVVAVNSGGGIGGTARTNERGAFRKAD